MERFLDYIKRSLQYGRDDELNEIGQEDGSLNLFLFLKSRDSGASAALVPPFALSRQKESGITLPVGFISPIIAVLFMPPKPDQSGMPISFKLAEAGAGLNPPKCSCNCFPENKC